MTILDNTRQGSGRFAVLSPSINIEASSKQSKTRQPSQMINYFLLVTNGLLFLLGLATAGLAGSTVSNTAPDGYERVYHLKPEVMSSLAAPTSNEILEFPLSFSLFGTQLVLAAGVWTTVSAAFVFALVLFGGLQVSKNGITTLYNPRRRLLSALVATGILIIFTVLVFAWSWSIFNNSQSRSLDFNSVTIRNRRYQSRDLSPEAWFKSLSESILDADSPSNPRTQYLIAAIARYLMAPLTAMQVLNLIGLSVLKERINPNAARNVAAAQEFRAQSRASVSASESDVELGSTRESLIKHIDGVETVEVTLEQQQLYPPKKTSSFGFARNLMVTPPGGMGAFANNVRH